MKLSVMSTRHVLADGTAVVLRPIAASDKEELQLGLHRLSPETVQKRFLAPKARFSSAELRYLTEVDGHDHVAIAVELDEQPGTIVAVGRYVRLRDHPETAEAAIVVADFLQRRGLGSLLAEALAAEAVRHGVLRFSATMLGDNVAARRLMTRLADHLETHYDGAGAAEVTTDLAA
jgi:RimJ/RimL family protein N-acetyltransferase